ncbi:MarR family transcriptional regulator [Streptomyces sp. TRM 70351]|uniref:GbsR/MarR family transcriptional regulator n=1 Tax=Streptomyces sp. TRM 70351 TaxID=3116552 RepID=UPI002E7B21DE|nr:MarR family transcriptional regulator [Streptomyces sp. TRM 70351]MEE1929878.1 MarR family transcriptional regulator [Streptomyces sp. TRM 70351]
MTTVQNADYPPQVADFVERFAADLTEAGMQRMASRVFACLLASERGALGSGELSERLRISPAAVSGAVRYLAQLHLVTRERLPGSRREQYRVHADVWHDTMASRDALLGRWLTTFTDGVAALGADTPAGRRVAESAAFLAFLREELHGIVTRWQRLREELRSAGGDGEAQG